MIYRFIFEEEGQSLVEYALLISLIALACAMAVTAFRGGVYRTYDNIGNNMTLNTSTS
ncbi:MAG TPA: hypothetical protein VF719_12120 [Abditibacteriaceae bacterium]|jgi:Flp pilus assembly pilin Flp